jgi:D-glycero-alpha-D-manno-heptose-7-phosphate kinase
VIISRTPFRISFAGGGTDLRSFYTKEPGKVLSTTIDKFIYVMIRRQVGIIEFKYRINWSLTEQCNRIDDIEHPIVREALRLFKIDFPIEISTFADIPAKTGLGSSSSFTVGLVHALHALKGGRVTKYKLASEAAHIEVDLLGRTMGKQDHFAASYGNLNVFTFHSNEVVTVEPVFYKPHMHQVLGKNLMLFYTQFKRDASKLLQIQEREVPNKFHTLRKMKELVNPLRDVISKGTDNSQFGEILHKGWELKRTLTDCISSSEINDYYNKGLKAGALGGKLLGAGGGGFLLFYVEPPQQKDVIQALSDLQFLEIGLDSDGTRITYYDQQEIQ